MDFFKFFKQHKKFILAFFGLVSIFTVSATPTDEDRLGKSKGYPVGTRLNWTENQFKVGSFSNYELEEHHIFPDKSNIGKEIKIKYQNTNNEDIINNIANIALITRETNNNRINKKNPSVYITEFEKEYTHFGKQAEFKTIMLSQFINDSALAALKNDDFETFIYERTKEIFLQVKILCD